MAEIRAGMREAKKLKKNLYTNVIPFKSDTIHAPPLLPKKEAAPRPDSGKGKAALRASPHNADQGPSIRKKLEDRESRPVMNRNPQDYRLVQRKPSSPRNTTQNRYTDSDGTVFPGHPAMDRASHSGPMANKSFREGYDNSFRDKSMSSDRSRDSRLREGATEKFQPSRNRDPRGWEGQQDRSYSYLQAKAAIAQPPWTERKRRGRKEPGRSFPKILRPGDFDPTPSQRTQASATREALASANKSRSSEHRRCRPTEVTLQTLARSIRQSEPRYDMRSATRNVQRQHDRHRDAIRTRSTLGLA